GLPELAFGAFDDDVARGDRDRDGLGDINWFSADSTHLKSPHVGDNLAADALLTRFVAGHHSGGAADDRGPGSTLDARHVFVIDVPTGTGSGDPVDPEDDRLA